MTVSRVAVAPGRHAVRIAGTVGGSAPRLLAELPAHGKGDRRAVLAAILGDGDGVGVREIVVVYPQERPAASVQEWLAAAETLAPTVLRVAAPVAAFRDVAATPGARAGPERGSDGAVLDVGSGGADATLLRAGRILGRRSCGIGGDRLDLAVRALLPGASPAEARRVREALSLQPEVRFGTAVVTAERVWAALTPLADEIVTTLGEVLAAASAPTVVLLTGGVARCPLLAERLDAADVAAEVRVAPRPELAAVLGALTMPLPPGSASRVGNAAPRATALVPALVPAREPAAPWTFLPAPPPQRLLRRWGAAAAAAVVVGAVAGAGTAVAVPARPAAPSTSQGEARTLVQYGYRFDIPEGWEHTGGLPERRRSLLTRAGAPEGTDLIAVERTLLGYAADAEPQRAAADLRAVFDRAVAAGSRLSDYGSAQVGGRAVTTYRQEEASGAVVEWVVVLDGGSQLSVGCRHTPAGADEVRAACAVVVASVGLT